MAESNAIDAVTASELSRAAGLFGTLKQLRMQLKNSDEDILDRAFETHVHGVLEKLEKRLPGLQDERRRVEVVMARHGLYDASFQQVVLLCHAIAPGLGDAVRELRAVQAGLLTDLQHSFCAVANTSSAAEADLSEASEAGRRMQEDVVVLQDTVVALNNESEDYKARILELRENIRSAAQQINYLREAVANNHKTLSDSKPTSVMAAAANAPTNPNALLDSSVLSYNSTYLHNTMQMTPHQRNGNTSAQDNTQMQNMHLTATQMQNTHTNPEVFGAASERSGNAHGPGANNFPLRSDPCFASQSGSPKWSNSSNSRLRRSTSNPSLSRGYNSGYEGDLGPGGLGTGTVADWNSSTKDALITDAWLRDLEEESAGSVVTGAGMGGGRSRAGTPNRARSSSGGTGGARTAAMRVGLSIAAPLNWLLLFRAEVQRALDEGRCRELSINECLEAVERLYQSKAAANQKALRGVGNVPMETMEQHLFRTYEGRYGLRSLAVEHAGALVKAVTQYAPQDNEVLVFCKIFRNELEEGYREIQADLYASVKDLTLVQTMSRFPAKDQAAAGRLVDQKISVGVITEEEWVDMGNYLYNEEDSRTLCVILKKLAVTQRSQVTYFDPTGAKVPVQASQYRPVLRANTAYVMENATAPPMGYDVSKTKDVRRLGYVSPTLRINVKEPKSKKEPFSIPFSTFLRTVLDFQLRSHQQYLQNFVKVFRDIDRDVDGVVSAAEFRECYLLVRRVDQGGAGGKGGKGAGTGVTGIGSGRGLVVDGDSEEMRQFLPLISQIDPMGTDRITFSAAVTALSKM